MKPLPAFIAGAGLVLLLGAGSPDAGQPGRFALVPCQITTTGLAGTEPTKYTEETIFKLDTATGEAWHWVSINFNGTLREGWQKCENWPTQKPPQASETGAK